MINYFEELEKMVKNKNLMNSYKLYFLKALFMNVSNTCFQFSFYEMACWMCACSFEDVCKKKNRFRHLDKLYDYVVKIIEQEDIMESEKTTKVFNVVYNTKNRKMRNEIKSLCNYVPYRLIAYRWYTILKGLTDYEKNNLIENLSKSEADCIYVINKGYNGEKYIEVNNEWIEYLFINKKYLIDWIDLKIMDFIMKDDVI